MEEAEVVARVHEVVAAAEVLVGSHLGTVEVDVDAKSKTVRLRFGGACAGCPAMPVTFASRFWGPLLDVDGIDKVELLGGKVPEATLLRIVDFFGTQ